MIELVPIPCNRSCFDGWRGADLCGGCSGTGSQFVVGGKRFPNTKLGYDAAVAAKESLRRSQELQMKEGE